MTLLQAVSICGVFFAVAMVAAGAGLDERGGAILREDFAKPELAPAWRLNVSKGNTIVVKQGFAEIHAAENTYAHIERRLEVDRVRASCAIRPGSGISWCTSLFLYWKPGDWCQIGVIPRREGRV